MRLWQTSRRVWLQHSARVGLAWAVLQGGPARAQKMESGQLKTLAQMLDPITQGAPVLEQGVRITAPIQCSALRTLPCSISAWRALATRLASTPAHGMASR